MNYSHMPVHLQEQSLTSMQQEHAFAFFFLLLLAKTRNTVSYARDHVTTIVILHLDDAENSCRATWDEEEKRERLNEHLSAFDLV